MSANESYQRSESLDSYNMSAKEEDRLSYSLGDLEERKKTYDNGGFHLHATIRSARNLRRHQFRSQRKISSPYASSELTAIKESERLVNVAATEPVEEATSVLLELIRIVFLGQSSILLLFLPLGFVSYYWKWSATYIFWFNFLGLIPLASILGDFTEELALHTNQTTGALINATFGNAVEVVVAVQAMLKGEYRVVQSSMIGSALSNLLLVLGCCIFFGGLKHKEQKFNKTMVTTNMSLLALSTIGLVLPTPFAHYYEVQDEQVLWISRIAALFLMFMYLQLLFFQLKTHADVFEDEEENEKAAIPFWVAGLSLVIVTCMVAYFSDFLVASIDDFVVETGISKTFVGIIVIPIVGNAVEHLTAVSVAMKNKMDLALGVAIGSSAQVSLFVVPFIILFGWATDRNMTLNFPHFEVILYVLSIVIVYICLGNGSTHWLLGSLLISAYCMIAVGFWFENVVEYR